MKNLIYIERTVNFEAIMMRDDVSAASTLFGVAIPYSGSTFAGVPMGVGNDTIYGGTGDSAYWLSNGNNFISLEPIARCKREAANDAWIDDERRAA